MAMRTTEYPKIAAVFATMNRAPTALRCVQALAAQTLPPATVIIADNCSTDETVRELEALRDLPFTFIVHRMPENGGNAGGVEAAMELAFQENHDAVWILDDDSFPRHDCLEHLTDGYDPGTVPAPIQINPETGNFTWPQWIERPDGSRALISSEAEMGGSARISTAAAWTGALISRRIREAIGPVNGALFIRGEDEEYPWRIARAGFRFELVRRDALDHIGPNELTRFRFFGKNLFIERNLSHWKVYYKIRNMVWLKRRQNGLAGALAMAGAYSCALIVTEGTRHISILFRAIRDGLTGRLGKTIDPTL